MCVNGGKLIIGSSTSAGTNLLDVNGTAGKTGTSTWAVFSDARLKQNIKPYSDGLKSILKIKPVVFHYNKLSGLDTAAQYIGVLAQELKETAPYMVTATNKKNTDGAEAYLQVDNGAMTYMLINAMKEQQKMIEDLKKENKAMQVKNQTLSARIKKLETKKR